MSESESGHLRDGKHTMKRLSIAQYIDCTMQFCRVLLCAASFVQSECSFLYVASCNLEHVHVHVRLHYKMRLATNHSQDLHNRRNFL